MAIDIYAQVSIFLFFFCFISLLLSQSIHVKLAILKRNPPKKHPPSPPALPIIGHLHLLGIKMHKSFQDLATRYGPLITIRIGASTIILVSNAAGAKEVFKTQELNFVYRPELAASDYSIYKDSGFAFHDYGSYWRFFKKLCMMKLLSPLQINHLVDVRKQELTKLLEAFAKYSEKGEACDLGKELMVMTNNTICRMMMSTRCSEDVYQSVEVREFVEGIMKLATKLSLGEVLGPLKKFDLLGIGRKLREYLLQFDKLVDGILVEHEKERFDGVQKQRKDIMDILLDVFEDETAELKLTRKDIKAFLLDMFVAGTHSTMVALQWTIAELINHPDVLKKLKEEINKVVGSSRIVKESDIPDLPYLQAIIKESLRLHPPLPMIIRKCKEECKINGYNILANSRILVNTYAIMRSPDSWDNPVEFSPERFLEKNAQISLRGHSFDYLPFGSGRRSCPGAGLVAAVMHVTIAALIQCFDWKVKDGEKVDMEEGSSFSIGMAKPLLCYPTVNVNLWKIN